MMQSFLVYGRLFARSVISGFTNNDFQPQLSLSPSKFTSLTAQAQTKSVHLVTAECGIAKSASPDSFKKWSFGDDACFIAHNSHGEFIGEGPTLTHCLRLRGRPLALLTHDSVRLTHSVSGQ